MHTPRGQSARRVENKDLYGAPFGYSQAGPKAAPRQSRRKRGFFRKLLSRSRRLTP